MGKEVSVRMKRFGTNGQDPTQKRRRVIWVVLLLLVVAVVAVGMTQGNNLRALYRAARNDKETLAQMQQEQDKARDEMLEEYGLKQPDETTQEEQSDPAADSADPQEDETADSAEAPSNEDSTEGSNGDADRQAELQRQLQQKTDQLYAVEGRYRAAIEGVVAQAKSEFWSLPPDQRTNSNKMAIVSAKAGALAGQEGQCDAEVYAIVGEIRSILQQMGKSTALADQIKSYYEGSKANWKASKMAELYG